MKSRGQFDWYGLIQPELIKRYDLLEVVPRGWGLSQANRLYWITSWTYDTWEFEQVKIRVKWDLANVHWLRPYLTSVGKTRIDYCRFVFTRYFTIWSSFFAEWCFALHPGVSRVNNKYCKEADITGPLLGNVDIKVSVYPRTFGYGAMAHPDWIVAYLNDNQSDTQRFNTTSNKIYVVLVDMVAGEHWRLRSNFKLIQEAIDRYVSNGKYGPVVWVINR